MGESGKVIQAIDRFGLRDNPGPGRGVGGGGVLPVVPARQERALVRSAISATLPSVAS